MESYDVLSGALAQALSNSSGMSELESIEIEPTDDEGYIITVCKTNCTLSDPTKQSEETKYVASNLEELLEIIAEQCGCETPEDEETPEFEAGEAEGKEEVSGKAAKPKNYMSGGVVQKSGLGMVHRGEIITPQGVQEMTAHTKGINNIAPTRKVLTAWNQ